MGKLKNYARTSDIMNINLTIGQEQFQFNLYEELVISEEKVNSEIKEQPSVYAFLTTLHKRLVKEMMLAEKEMEKSFSDIYNRYKERVNDNTGRVYDKDYAHHIANANPGFNRARTKFIKAKYDVGVIDSAIKSFEQRFSLIQTLSANLRKEK